MIRKISAKSSRCLGHDYSPHRADAVGLEKHVLGTAKPDALGAKAACHSRVGRGLGIGANLHLTDAVRPAHQGREIP